MILDFKLTLQQIRGIYDAGRRRGNDEYSAFDWGCSPSNQYLYELEECLIWDKETGLCNDMDYDEKTAFWGLIKKEFENEVANSRSSNA